MRLGQARLTHEDLPEAADEAGLPVAALDVVRSDEVATEVAIRWAITTSCSGDKAGRSGAPSAPALLVESEPVDFTKK